MNEKRCRGAVKELIDKGYLIQKESEANRYTFFELPNQNIDVQNHAPNTPDNAVPPPVSGRVSARNGSVDIPQMGREIVQNSTTNNTTNSISNNTTNNTESYIDEEIDEDELRELMGDSASDYWDDDRLPF